METLRLNYSAALGNYRANKGRKFPGASDSRSRLGMIFPTLTPGFAIEQGSSVFAIGSCFARNVEEALTGLGFDVPTAAFEVPQGEVPGRSNRVLNQYNAGTMAEVVQMTLARGAIEGAVYDMADGLVGDGLLTLGIAHPVSRARLQERRAQIVALYRSGMQACNTVVITLGLVECWYDLEDRVFLNNFPGQVPGADTSARFEFRRLGVDDCLDLLSGMLETISADRRRNVLLTVSPVPHGASFMNADAVQGNAYSKAVLRVVADELARRFAFVDYFPSYEIVTSGGTASFEVDQIHVRDDVVQEIVGYMLSQYVPSTDDLSRFSPDLADPVRN